MAAEHTFSNSGSAGTPREFGTENARYACVSLNDAYAPPEIRERSVCIDGDLKETIETLARN